MSVTCPYCFKDAALASGREVYPHRPDLHLKPFYLCQPCRAWVGCHPGTTKPLGRLADAKLRSAKMRVHAAFDPHWKGTKNITRGRCYRRLARDLGIAETDCHVGMFDLETCERALGVIAQWPMPTAYYSAEPDDQRGA